MSYRIFINNKKDTKVDVHLDNHKIAIYPQGPMLFGTGSLADKYTKHIENCFSKDNRMSNYLAWLHRQGKEHGNLNLICNKPKLRSFYPQAIKAFLEKNRETLDLMLPYLFKDYVAPQGEASSMQTMKKATLPPEDMAQIQQLILEDQQKEAQLREQDVDYTPPVINETPNTPAEQTQNTQD